MERGKSTRLHARFDGALREVEREVEGVDWLLNWWMSS